MTYKAALFDLDDTIVSSVKSKMLQHKVIAKRHYDVDISDELLHECWGKPLSTMVELMYRNVDSTERILNVLLETDDEFPKGIFEGCADALSRVLDAGIPVGVITSAPTNVALKDLARHGLPVNELLCVLGEDAVEARKPDPRVFDKPLAMLSDLGIDNGIAYVGDHFVDLQASLAAGLDFIAVTSGIVEAHEFQAAGATHITPGIVTAINVILGDNTTDATYS